MCVWGWYLYRSDNGSQRYWILPELELKALVNHPLLVLGTQLGSSARALLTAEPPAPCISLIKKSQKLERWPSS